MLCGYIVVRMPRCICFLQLLPVFFAELLAFLTTHHYTTVRLEQVYRGMPKCYIFEHHFDARSQSFQSNVRIKYSCVTALTRFRQIAKMLSTWLYRKIIALWIAIWQFTHASETRCWEIRRQFCHAGRIILGNVGYYSVLPFPIDLL